MFLPVEAYKDQIVNAVLSTAFTIITAHSASGKSTMVPRFLSEAFDKVVVTNPRVMPCITLATYVASQMGITLGREVGYRTGYNKCSTANTKIEYVTDAFHLIRTIFNESSGKKIALVIDEVHEFTVPTETLVAWCKFMKDNWNVKVVLMSATMETASFVQYFGKNNSKVLEIPGKLYDVSVREEPKRMFDEVVREKIREGKNLLVFLPSKRKIYEMIEKFSYENAVLLPLHGELSWEEQKRCYDEYSKPKVVFATNIAQTSVTIPGINVVVDTGEAIVPVAENGIIDYRIKEISQADIKQRMWRAGRMENGEYILCSDTPIKDRMPYPVPEIQRSLLDQVALKLASSGIDIADLEFIHQPSDEQIKEAKEKLVSSGAISSSGYVTEVGNKISRMPLSVDKARMIIEAEKYDVVEEVIIIACILEVGGLRQKTKNEYGKFVTPNYSNFTTEKNSDLLAEYDIWNQLIDKEYVDFKKLQINRKRFYNSCDHVIKMREALEGIVEVTSGGGRENILRACLSVYTSNIHVHYDRAKALGADDVVRTIDNKSCVFAERIRPTDFFVGTPIRISGTDRYDDEYEVNLLTFVSKIDYRLLVELVPEQIEKLVYEEYSKYHDAVLVENIQYFRGRQIAYEREYDYDHPRYQELKEKYEEERRSLAGDYLESPYHSFDESSSREKDEKQQVIEVDGKRFDVSYSYDGTPYVYLTNEEIFGMTQDELFLDNGTRVELYLKTLFFEGRKANNVKELRNALELKYKSQALVDVKYGCQNVQIHTLEDLLKHTGMLGGVELEKDIGYIKASFGRVYVSAYLDRNTVVFKVVEDEETARSNTSIALEFLFKKEVDKRYPDGKFSHMTGKKKKILTDSENAKKEEFYSLVRECMRELSLDNALEHLEFLEEYYQELVS